MQGAQQPHASGGKPCCKTLVAKIRINSLATVMPKIKHWF
jgi:hypothetical protein